MFKHVFLGMAVAVSGLSAPVQQAAAQSGLANDASQMSAEELEALFSKQRTRGLVIAPSQGGGATGADPGSAPAGTAAVQSDTGTAVTYVELAPEEQVSIQIRFDFDSSALRDDQKPKLVTLCQVMRAAAIEKFRIVGHTDAAGSESYNERLSLLRAQEVKRQLVGGCGIAAERLEAVGVGEAFPLDRANPVGDVNRRVEFQALS